MQSILVHAHSGIRWILLMMMIYILIRGHIVPDTRKKVDWPLFTLIVLILQMVLGLIILFGYDFEFTSDIFKNKVSRFYAIEHTTGMLVALILMLVGYFRYLRSTMLTRKRTLRIFYGLAFIVMLLSIPWPFRGLGNGWF